MMSPKLFDVAVVGSVGIDTNVYLHNNDIDFSVESNYTENLDYVGSSGGYSSRAYAQLGWRTAFIGYVGADHNGEFIRKEFARDNINSEALFTGHSGTDRSINFMYRDGRRKNFYDGKGHMQQKPDLEKCRAIFKKTRMAHFSIPNWARYLLPLANELEIPIACDIQDITSIDDPYRQDFINYADFLFFSAVNYEDPASLIHQFLLRKPSQVILTGMGARGCAIGTTNGIQYFNAVDLEQPVVDTNGAGDSLAAGFLSSYLLEGYSIHQSVLRGQIAARHACTLKADSSHLVRREQLDEYYHAIKWLIQATLGNGVKK
ncbi:carbohydrate kinase family protein [Chloroflexota bacterium]